MKRFGKREIEIGRHEFDRRYLIKSNNADTTMNLLSGEITGLILKYHIYSLSFFTGRNKQDAKLTSVISRNINDKLVLTGLIHFHEKLVDRFISLHIV